MNTFQKLRIMFVHEVSYLDKVVFEMHEFPELLSMRGHDVFFIDFPEDRRTHIRSFSSPKEIEGRAFRDANIKLYSLPNVLIQPFGRIVAAVGSFYYLKKVIKLEQPDLVVLYGVATNGFQTILAAKKFKIPVVHRAIDVSHLLRPGLLSRFIPIAEKLVFRFSTEIVANNRALANYISAKSGNPREVQVQFPGVKKVSQPLQINTEQESKEFDFVFMGTLFRFSGLDWFIQQLKTNPEIQDCSLLIIGDGESRTELERLVSRLNLTSRVVFTGRVDFNELYAYVSQGKVAILPFNEIEVARLALPGKVFQYLTFGLPTVSTRLDGLMSCLPQSCGVLYSAPGRDFVRTAKELIENESERTQVVADGQRYLSEIGDWTTVIDAFEKTLIQTLNKHRK